MEFSNKEIRSITGLNTNQVSGFSNRSIITPQVSHEGGSGKYRKYSELNVFQYGIASALDRLGVRTEKVDKVLIVLVDELEWIHKLASEDKLTRLRPQILILFNSDYYAIANPSGALQKIWKKSDNEPAQEIPTAHFLRDVVVDAKVELKLDKIHYDITKGMVDVLESRTNGEEEEEDEEPEDTRHENWDKGAEE